MSEEQPESDPEIVSISKVYLALKDLDRVSQSRVLGYVTQKLGIQNISTDGYESPEPQKNDGPKAPAAESPTAHAGTGNTNDDQSDELGISPAGNKWAKRNGLSGDQLSKIFSLGVDEIDLVSNSVPGDSKKDKMRSVFLLRGIAAYLSTGTAKFAHDVARETCLHYDAWDTNNFSRMLASIASEVSGSKESGYTLTARGLTNAAELIRSLVQKK